MRARIERREAEAVTDFHHNVTSMTNGRNSPLLTSNRCTKSSTATAQKIRPINSKCMKTEHDKMKGRFACSSLVALTSAAAWLSSIQPVARAQIVEPAFGNPLARVRHIIVIYQENWSFDSLYGKFPGANGFAYSFPMIPQFDLNGNSICQLPQPIGNNGLPTRISRRTCRCCPMI